MGRLHFAVAVGLSLVVCAPAAAQVADSAAFIDAVRKADGNKATELLEKRPLGLVDSRGEGGETPLTVAIARRDEQWTGFLLTKGANPNLPGKDGDTPLIVAARAGFGEAVDWLIGAKARVEDDNRMGETALIVAVQQRNLPIVRSLLAAGANPDKSDFTGYSARDHARRDPRARDILKAIEAKKPPAATKP